jgi:hypothetical protein
MFKTVYGGCGAPLARQRRRGARAGRCHETVGSAPRGPSASPSPRCAAPRAPQDFIQERSEFLDKVNSKSGLDPNGTYLPPAVNPTVSKDYTIDMKTAMLEAETVMGGAVADVLEKTGEGWGATSAREGRDRGRGAARRRGPGRHPGVVGHRARSRPPRRGRAVSEPSTRNRQDNLPGPSLPETQGPPARLRGGRAGSLRLRLLAPRPSPTLCPIAGPRLSFHASAKHNG